MKATALAVLAALAAAPARAAGGGSPFAFLALDGNSRPAALGGAYAALAADASALHYNPAGLGRLQAHEATLMHHEHFQGARRQYGAVALRQGVGIQFHALGYDKTQRTTLSNPSGAGLGTFGSRDLAVGAGFGRLVAAGLSLGAGVKYLRSEIDAYSGSGVAVDLGALYAPARLPGLAVGLAAQNLGGTARFQSASERLPANVKAGAAYRVGSASREATVALDVNRERRAGLRVGAGVEAKPTAALALRLGFDGRNDAGPGLTAGVGVGNRRLWADYAFVPYGDLGSSHQMSLTLRWGATGGAP